MGFGHKISSFVADDFPTRIQIPTQAKQLACFDRAKYKIPKSKDWGFCILRELLDEVRTGIMQEKMEKITRR